MEKILEQTLLYDFYGELLTEHQKQIYELYLDDLSLSEIANELGISRQGVHDLIKRCNKILDGYEEKLRLVQKFITAKEKVNEIHMLTKEYKANNDAGLITKIEEISNEILEEFW